MYDLRLKRSKYNIVSSLASQMVVLICGLIIPRLMIDAFGSEGYGATTSITQFLSYIALLEGGIGGVARAALYKPLAKQDTHEISAVVAEIKRFFRVIGYIFFVYVAVLACSFKYISGLETFDWFFTFGLVIAISISTFAQYFIGISYTVLIQAGQRSYITNTISIITTIVNTVSVVFLINLDCNLIIVKLVSSLIFVLRPVLAWLYVKKEFKLIKCPKDSEKRLKQKWTGLGQHLAFYLHSHTDVAILTIFSSLSNVAIYSVYHMVIYQMQNFASSFATGMEALFGDMLAKREDEGLSKTFGYYESLISVVAIILFSVTAVMIIPFVSVYTRGIDDANYLDPWLAFFLIMASMLYCLRAPYHSMVIAAGHFKQTKYAAYGEAVLNILLSILFVNIWDLSGVGLATAIATAFRFLYYVIYLKNNIINRKVYLFLKRECVNMLGFFAVLVSGILIVNNFDIAGYGTWILAAAVVTIIAVLIVLMLNMLFYRNDFLAAIRFFLKKQVKN